MHTEGTLYFTNESIRHLVMSSSLWLHGLEPSRLPCPWDFPGKNTGVCCRFLLQKIFLTQGSNPGLLYCKRILFHQIHQGSPISQIVLNKLIFKRVNTVKVTVVWLWIYLCYIFFFILKVQSASEPRLNILSVNPLTHRSRINISTSLFIKWFVHKPFTTLITWEINHWFISVSPLLEC